MLENRIVPRENHIDTSDEKVIEISPTELHLFKNRPFKVKDDDSMMETAGSIQ